MNEKEIDRNVEIKSVKVLDGFRVLLKFSDGVSKEIDLEKYLHGPVFEEIRNDPKVFRKVRIDRYIGTICWPGDVDIAPDTLRYDLTPVWMEEEAEAAKSKPAK